HVLPSGVAAVHPAPGGGRCRAEWRSRHSEPLVRARRRHRGTRRSEARVGKTPLDIQLAVGDVWGDKGGGRRMGGMPYHLEKGPIGSVTESVLNASKAERY